ncbi:MAG: trypsin-like peptidase domain-containing protein [Micromonosporaceae bacterium]|nr:trypsin-like peptidase domain-containing protein [Micromonosporaceae bacterium]
MKNAVHHTNLVRFALVRVLGPDGVPVGFGLLVAAGRVVTCAHVAALSLGEQECLAEIPVRRRVRLDFPFLAPGRILTAAVVAWAPMAEDGTGDIAGLELDDEVPEQARAMPIARSGDLDGHQVQTYGYHGEDWRNAPTWVVGSIVSQTEQGWLQLGLSNATGGLRIRRGFSGSPVWNQHTGQIVGLISRTSLKKDLWLSYAIPGQLIFAAWPDLQAMEMCPFRALTPFTHSDRNLFFGREALAAKVVNHIIDADLCLVTGASGSGKTSLMRAAVAWRLGERGLAAVMIRPLSRDSVWETLAAALARMKPGDDAIEREHHLVTLLTSGSPDRRIACITDCLSVERFVVIVDQFEDLVLQRTQRANDFAMTLRQFPAVRHREGGPIVRVVIVARSDLETEVRSLLGGYDSFGGYVSVEPFTEEQLRAAIEQPVRLTGFVRYEDHLVAKIIDDLRTQPYCLPTLQVVLTDLWHMGRATGVLSHRDYEAINHDSGPLASHLERIWNDNLRNDDRTAAQRLLLHLVIPLDGERFARRTLHRDEIDAPEWDVAGTLANQRLVVLSGGPTETPTVELTHDTLIDQWPTLAQHLADNRDFVIWRDSLRRRISAWEEHGHRPSQLITRAELATGLDYARRRTNDITTREGNYLRRSRQRQRLLRRRVFAVFVLFVALAILTTTAAVVAVQRDRRADEQYRIAVTRRAILQAEALRATTFDTALAIGVAAMQVNPSPETRSSLVTTLLKNRFLSWLNESTHVYHVAWSPDGNTIITGGSNTVLCDVSDPIHPKQVPGNLPHGYPVAIGPNGHVVAFGAELWDITEPLAPLKLATLTEEANVHPLFSADGRRLAVGGADSVTLWEISETGRPTRASTIAAKAGNIAFRRSGQDLLVSDDNELSMWSISDMSKPVRRALTRVDGEIVAISRDGSAALSSAGAKSGALWELTDPARPAKRGAISGIGDYAVLSPDGSALATADESTGVVLWDLTDSTLPEVASWTGGATHVEFSPDGRFFAVGNSFGTLTLWRTTSLAQTPKLATFSDHSDPVKGLSFGYDGRILAAGSPQSIQLWDLTDPRRPTRRADIDAGGTFMAFSPRAPLLAVSDQDGTTIWDVGDPTRPARQATIGDAVEDTMTPVFTADGRFLAIANNNHDLQIWDLLNPRRPTHQVTIGANAASAAFSPDRRSLVVGSHGNEVTLWEISDITAPRLLPGPRISKNAEYHTDSILSVAFSADGRILASGDADEAVALWDSSDTHDVSEQAFLFEQPATKVAINQRSPQLATRNSRGLALIWDITYPAHPTSLVTLTPQVNGTWAIAISPDGSVVVTGDNSGIVALWDVRPLNDIVLDPISCACTITLGLSGEDWHQYFPGLPFKPTCP